MGFVAFGWGTFWRLAAPWVGLSTQNILGYPKHHQLSPNFPHQPESTRHTLNPIHATSMHASNVCPLKLCLKNECSTFFWALLLFPCLQYFFVATKNNFTMHCIPGAYSYSVALPCLYYFISTWKSIAITHSLCPK